MRTRRTRSGDTTTMLVLKWVAGVVAVLAAGFIGWTANTVVSLLQRVDLLEWTLKFKGMWIQ